MKVMIVSDSHGQSINVLNAIQNEGRIDMLIHCGDIEGDEEVIQDACMCPIVMVRGNNDYFSHLEKDVELIIGKYSVWVTHGHLHSVTFDTEMLKEAARARFCDLVFYGHTHRPEIDLDDDVIVINPGSISVPRQKGRKRSYCIMQVDENGRGNFELKYL
jgi:putative phosphoesterase